MRRCLAAAGLALVLAAGPVHGAAQDAIPALTDTVNDFAGVIDAESRREMDAVIRALQRASGDVVVVATIRTYQPYGDIREYAVEMFENHGRGIGQKGLDNGLLVLLAVEDRQVWIEVGYDLEQFITDGYAGETSRQYMIPEFRNGSYGRGLLAGVQRVAARIAQGRNVTLDGVQVPPPRPVTTSPGSGGSALLALFVLFLILNAVSGRLRGRRRRRRWYSGVGPFGGGFGGGFGGFGGGGRGGFGGGGFGGGFGGFGGGRSGGGGGGGSW